MRNIFFILFIFLGGCSSYIPKTETIVLQENDPRVKILSDSKGNKNIVVTIEVREIVRKYCM